MDDLIKLIWHPQSRLYLIVLTLYFVWLLRAISQKTRQLNSVALDVGELQKHDFSQYVKMSKEAILDTLQLHNRAMQNRVKLIVNYAISGLPYARDILESNEDELFDMNAIINDLNMFPLLGLVGTTIGLVLALLHISPQFANGAKVSLELVLPSMTLSFTSTLYSIIYLFITYFFFYSRLRKLKARVVEDLDATSLDIHMALLRSKDIYKISAKFYESIDRLEASIRYSNEGAKYLNVITTNLNKFSESLKLGGEVFTNNQELMDQKLQEIRSFIEMSLKKSDEINEKHFQTVSSIVGSYTNAITVHIGEEKMFRGMIGEKLSEVFEHHRNTLLQIANSNNDLVQIYSSTEKYNMEGGERIRETLDLLNRRYDASNKILSELSGAIILLNESQNRLVKENVGDGHLGVMPSKDNDNKLDERSSFVRKMLSKISKRLRGFD